MKPYLILVLVLFLLSSCSSEEKPMIQTDGVNLIFFTDDAHFEKEISYYDAILELRKTYPTLVNKMKVITPNDLDRLEEQLHVDEFPALLITNGNTIIFSVEGAAPKEEIINPVVQLLSSN
ncbi:hypothetical protein SAMN05877753_1086 [Bacillus oleivorans]|uniref:Small peptidoglycan-associated lipoprotein n=1 Tax=Bacillus oleivorans TaxID=1448271 RepID=A0A285D235_9BACI|nr:hypothetical protein [Bacillus oleivorans]SNX73871.1 hypothetical protein SAMN05877753_1086 [Bacillus oleivorans]